MTKIFVFGSNLAGRHGMGTALYAKKYYGAIYGQGQGLQGTSYAIPTKDENLVPLPLWKIEKYVLRFLNFAKDQKEFVFKVTPIGCGLAGYSPKEIAPFFKHRSDNVILPTEFLNEY